MWPCWPPWATSCRSTSASLDCAGYPPSSWLVSWIIRCDDEIAFSLLLIQMFPGPLMYWILVFCSQDLGCITLRRILLPHGGCEVCRCAQWLGRTGQGAFIEPLSSQAFVSQARESLGHHFALAIRQLECLCVILQVLHLSMIASASKCPPPPPAQRQVPAAGWTQIFLFLGLVEKGIYTYDPTRSPGDYKNAGDIYLRVTLREVAFRWRTSASFQSF